MKVLVVGATGHIGSYLVPRLVHAGHEVVAYSRGTRTPYVDDPAWRQVTSVTVDRPAEDLEGTFGQRVRAEKADAVVDLICFDLPAAEHLAEALRGSDTALVHCGTIWVHGPAVEVPVREDAARTPFGTYGVAKAQIESYLLSDGGPGGVRSTVLHPGHISGPGWPMINPAGNLDPGVWKTLASGRPLALPSMGLETLHHVHADDVAQAFQLAVERFDEAAGQSFHVVSSRAVTLRGFAETVAAWFGRSAQIEAVSWKRFRQIVGGDHADTTWEHVSRSPSMSIEKAESVLGYQPRFSSLQTAAAAARWLAEHGDIDVDPGQIPPC